MKYRLRVPNSFKKTAQKKEKLMQAAIAECLRLLQISPRDPKLNTHKMKGRKGIWECYIDNDGNRITFEYSQEEADLIILRNNCNHDMLYRNP